MQKKQVWTQRPLKCAAMRPIVMHLRAVLGENVKVAGRGVQPRRPPLACTGAALGGGQNRLLRHISHGFCLQLASGEE